LSSQPYDCHQEEYACHQNWQIGKSARRRLLWESNIADAGALPMSAQIIQFRKYQKSRELARMHGDIEKSLAKLSVLAAQVFDALRNDAAAGVSGMSSRQPAYTIEPRFDHPPTPSR
jgi:hypothetical protein